MEIAHVIKLEIPSSPEFVSVARKTLEAIASGLGMPNREIEDLELAVGEACANAVKYGEADTVLITYRIEKNSVEIEVCNKGKAFTPPTCPLPMEELRVGGLGIFLIDQLVDKMSIDCESGRTTLKMVKQFARTK